MEQLLDTAPIQDLPPLVLGFILIWMFMLGACVGSFMNVVIYRLPAGLSIVHPASRCPVCEHAIRARDNVPVLGWLMLRGRCRDCGAAISPRYPAVEATVGLVFLCLALALPLTGAHFVLRSDLPIRDVLLWALFAGYATLVCTLICAALIELDRQAIPLKLFLPALAVALLVRLYWSQQRGWITQVDTYPSGWQDGLRDGLTALAWGGLCGAARWCEVCRLRNAKHVAATIIAAATTAVVVSYQAAALVLSLTAVTYFVAKATARAASRLDAINWFGLQTVATLVVMLGWNALAAVPLFTRPGYSSVIVAVILVATMSLLAGLVARPTKQAVQ